MACSGFCCGVDTRHTLSTIISLSTCTFWHYWLLVAKKIPKLQKEIVIICVVFDLVYRGTIVENVVAKGAVFY
jgi:hypothetical protein